MREKRFSSASDFATLLRVRVSPPRYDAISFVALIRACRRKNSREIVSRIETRSFSVRDGGALGEGDKLPRVRGKRFRFRGSLPRLYVPYRRYHEFSFALIRETGRKIRAEPYCTDRNVIFFSFSTRASLSDGTFRLAKEKNCLAYVKRHACMMTRAYIRPSRLSRILFDVR